LARAAINWATSEYGRKAAPQSLDFEPPNREPDSGKDNEECVAFLTNAMDELDGGDRELLYLAYVEVWTLEEIAEEKKLTVNQVWYRLNKLKRRLRWAVERQM
jgi:RNA polymerase sigma factor (sigma-70 family)